MKRIMLGVTLVALLGLAGCKGWVQRKDECLKHQPYEDAQSVPLLKGTDALPAPQSKQVLKIADAPALGGVKLKCLDSPPAYSSGTVVAPKAVPKVSEGFHEPVAGPTPKQP
jgi:hypothetical protein